MTLHPALVDRARRLSIEPTGPKVEGTTQYAPVTGEWFACRLTIPAGTEADDAERGTLRYVQRAQLIVGMRDRTGVPLTIKPDDQVEVNSPALGQATWQVVGAPRPLRTARNVIGYAHALVRVDA